MFRRAVGGCFVPLPLSRQELADLTGTTLETAIRVMSRWGKEGVVFTRRDGFLVHDRTGLDSTLGADHHGPADLRRRRERHGRVEPPLGDLAPGRLHGASKALISGLTSPAVVGSYRPGNAMLS